MYPNTNILTHPLTYMHTHIKNFITVCSRNIADLEQNYFWATFINIIIVVVVIETRSHTVAQDALELGI